MVEFNWMGIATSLLTAGGGNTVANAAGALEQTGKLLNHFFRDDPEKAAMVERAFLNALLDYINQLRGLKDGQDATQIVLDFDKFLNSK
jgi:hypothetical protein